ncbi:Metallo-dependent phosphatase-like protein [Entophlyctis helioformis]|nr:Metallo-dependent phosphatase-like protein [Entophlyctis helioformis]
MQLSFVAAALLAVSASAAPAAYKAKCVPKSPAPAGTPAATPAAEPTPAAGTYGKELPAGKPAATPAATPAPAPTARTLEGLFDKKALADFALCATKPTLEWCNPPKDLTILHTNDVHAHFDESNSGGVDCSAKNKADNKCFGGVARIKTVVDQIRANTTNVLLMDAGDQFQGTLFYNIFGGSPSVEFMNDLKYDVMSLGNHEFDSGLAPIESFIKNVTFPVLASNIDFKTAPSLYKAGVRPYTVIKKYSLGIVGYITNTTADITLGAKNIKFSDPAAPVQFYVDALRKAGVKRVICVSHNGYNEDKYLAANTNGIDLIVGGHSHSLLLANTSISGVAGPYPTAVTNKGNSTTYIVQASRYTNYLGRINIAWNDKNEIQLPTGQPILLDQTVAQNNATQTRVLKLRESFSALTNKIVATSTAVFNTSTCYTAECASGSLISDCMLEKEQPKGVSIAFTNAGGIRAGFNAGNISYADVITVLPFGNTLATFSATGAKVMEMLERVAAGVDKVTGKKVISLPQWGGIRWTYNPSAPAYSRVRSVEVAGKPLDVAATYKLVTNDFVAAAGDNILAAPEKFTIGDVMADVVAECLTRRKTISPTVDGRFATTTA